EPLYHIIFTAETHNFPTGVAPFPGAETGTGGRIRDVHATGKGSLVVAGTAGYCVGNLFIPNYPLKWEHGSLIYPNNLATPLKIIIEASNGASDYGNKFGEPLIQGITRSFGLRLHDNTRWEWIKPIMFTGGVGQIDNLHIEKLPPQKGMLVVKIGGPAYRIGIGGGSASSMISGDNIEALDFNAVQRGDAEMEQKLNRVIRACVEMGKDNPIVSIHDQGAGGNCNVVKEIIYPEGAKIDINKIILGDNTLSYLEIWGAEYQEQDAILIQSDRIENFSLLCKREKLPFAVIGEITGDKRLFLYSSKDNIVIEDLPLEKALGDMPKKTYELFSLPVNLEPLVFKDNTNIAVAIEMVLRHLSVCSKRFLTTKVDRSVTGLIAQQQCVGPLQLPLSDFAMISQSHFSKDGKFTGAAISIGEQPIKSLINPSAMARLSVAEALTNIVWAGITDLEDIKCSANWMWAPKLEGEGVKLYYAAKAMSDFMISLGIAVDGGKDSLSMAAKVLQPDGSVEIVKSPPTLVISAYAPVEDISVKATPDIKFAGKSKIMFIDLSDGFNRLGGSVLANCLKQIGDSCPDVCEPQLFKNAFKTIQLLLKEGFILSGHDRSDGGLITALLEMAFAGNCGLTINIEYTRHGILKYLFSEEPGLLFEYLPKDEFHIISLLEKFEVPYTEIATTSNEQEIKIVYNGELMFQESMLVLRDIWEETSFRLDALQANPDCVQEEKKAVYGRKGMSYKIQEDTDDCLTIISKSGAKPSVAIIREEGSNGDREMASAFYYAGFETWDVTMTDLLYEKISLSRFKGIAFVGGFSYADVLDSAKGWAGSIKFNKNLFKEFDDFYNRTDTFSLGVCNGCQLMALLGWIPYQGIETERQPRFIHNISGRFESRFLTVKILNSPSIMLQNMSDTVIGVWIAHGEGQAYFPDNQVYHEIITNSLAPIRYVDDNHEVTERYPFNPNGSKDGITALCSVDGRHLAMMPHPE
ncbi:MAG: phosphoribosylformylglycinamidine synthase, partial [Thermodesulfovibrionales bacterium]|nr:phosphoribosylformylglycinamidine synthase [Thermodesulfovibrionales bacterium]